MMAEVKDDEEQRLSPLPSKRKPVPSDKIEEEVKVEADDSTKKQKLETCSYSENNNNHSEEEEEEEDDEEEDYEGEDDDDDEDEDGDRNSNEASGEIDRKGKGIMRDVKGKGKLIEKSDDDSSDLGSVDDDDDDDDSDLSDDPLAEVDLDNILPSRTRQLRRHLPPPTQSGIFISDDAPKKKGPDNSSNV